MNLREEKRAQMLQEAVELLQLSERNRELAGQYLEIGKKELLEEVQKQDFYTLEEAAHQKSADYVEYCERESFEEERKRYIRFTAGVGGSTLFYLLGEQLYTGLSQLTSAQEAAVLAEQAAWEETRLNRESLLLLFALAEKRPRSLREALKLCYRKGYNVQLLLLGIYLYEVKPKHMMQGRTFGETEHVRGLSEHLAKVLTNSLSLLLPGGRASETQLKELKMFVECSEPSEAFPESFLALFRGRKFSGYLLKLLAGTAFLAVEHSDRFLVLLRVMAAMDLEMVLNACLDLGGVSWFEDHLERIEEILPVPMERYVQWCTARRMSSVLTRMAVRHPEAIQIASAALSTEDYQYLMKHMKAENASVHQGLNLAFSGVSRIRQAGELTAHYPAGRSEAKRYLLGSTGPESILPFVKEWREMDQWVRWDYEGTRSRLIEELKKDSLYAQMYQRAVVLEGLCENVMHFIRHTGGESWKGMTEEELLSILQIFEREKIPVRCQTDLLERLCSDLPYSPKGKEKIMETCVRVLIRKKEEWGAWYVTGVRDGSVFFRSLCIRVLGNFGEEYKGVLLPCAADHSIQVRQTFADVCTAHREWEGDVLAMLASSRAQERETAVQILKNWGADAYQKELRAALSVEKSGKLRELLQQAVGEEEMNIDEDPEALVKRLLKGSRKKKAAWACEEMPILHRPDGTEASMEEFAALLLCYADLKKPESSREAALLAERFDKGELEFGMKLLLERWIDTDADSKRKWVLYPAAIHGGERIVPLFQAMIRELMEKNRRFMAAEAVRALALNESLAARAFVEEMSGQIRNL